MGAMAASSSGDGTVIDFTVTTSGPEEESDEVYASYMYPLSISLSTLWV